MNELLLQKVLSAQIKAGKAVDISVTGISMEPALHQGDTVTVSALSSPSTAGRCPAAPCV